MPDNEKQFEQDIESLFDFSQRRLGKKPQNAGYRTGFQYDSTVCSRKTMPWILRRFVPLSRILSQCNGHYLKSAVRAIPRKSFIKPFKMRSIMEGLVNVLRHGFKHRGQEFKVIYFKPETKLNQLALTPLRGKYLPVYPPVALQSAQ